MTKSIIQIIAIVIFGFIIFSGPQVKIGKGGYFKLKEWQEGASIILIVIGVAWFGAIKHYNAYGKGLDKGKEIALKAVNELLEEKAKEMQGN